MIENRDSMNGKYCISIAKRRALGKPSIRPGLSLIFARPRPRAPMPPRPHRAALPPYDPVAVGRDGRPWGLPTRPWRLPTWPPGLPARAAAHGGSPPRCAALHPAPRPRHGARTAEAARYPYRTATGHAHYSSGAMGTSRPTAITHAKCALPLHPQNTHHPSRSLTLATCEKERTSTRMPARSFFGNHARSITNGECRLLCTMPHDTPRRPQAVCAQRHPSSPQAPQPWQPSAEACRQRALE